MKHWINTHYKSLIIGAFLVPIITVAIVSISHVTMWYGISNPVSWAIYLSIGIEIAALSALAAISADMGKKVYFPFAIVTLVQFIGNIFFAYSFIDINSKPFIDWVDLVSPLVSFMGVEPTDLVGHKRFLAFFAGGMLPIISLSFLHMLVKFTEEDRKKELEENKKIIKTEVIEKEITPVKEEENKVDASYLVSEISKINLSDEDIKKLEEVLLNPPPPNENLVKGVGIYHEKIKEQLKEIEGSIEEQSIIEDEVKVDEPIVDDLYLEKEEIINDKPISVEEKTLNLKQVVFEPVEKKLTEEERKDILIEMMQKDQELGLYDPPFDNPLIKEPVVSDDFTIGPEGAFEMTEEIHEELKQEPITPALSDEEVREMFMDEWERKFDLVEEEEEEFSNDQPTEEEVKPAPEPEKPYGFDYTKELDDAINGYETPEPTPTPEIVEETTPDVIEVVIGITPEEIPATPDLTIDVPQEPVEIEETIQNQEPEEVLEQTPPTIENETLPTAEPEEEKKNN